MIKYLHKTSRSEEQHPLCRDSGILFSVCTTISLVLLFFSILLTNGSFFSEFFYADTGDTGMDFFNSLAYTVGGEPYAQYNTLYPPLANLVFYILQWCVPVEISDQWASDYYGLFSMRGTSLDLRLNQAPMVLFLLFLLGIVLALSSLIRHLADGHTYSPQAVAVSCCFCSGALFTYERGNILILTVLLTLFFVFFYNSEQPVIREFALISLAIAAGLKLYPAMFGLLLLLEKRWNQALRAICYGLVAFFLPFFAFGGLYDLRLFLQIFFSFNQNTSQRFCGFGLNSIMATMCEFIYRISGITIEFQQTLSLLILVLTTTVLLIALVRTSVLWKRLLCVTLLLVFLQSSTTYTLTFFLIPFLAFLWEHPVLEKKDLPWFVCFMVLLLPYPLPSLCRYSLVVLGLAVLTLLVFLSCGHSELLAHCSGKT